MTLDNIARIYKNKGDVDQALKLHKAILEVFEQLGDIRSRALTLGDIARFYDSKGDVDEALKFHKEMLQVFEQLGDRRASAVTLGDIAPISNRGMLTKRSSSTRKNLKCTNNSGTGIHGP